MPLRKSKLFFNLFALLISLSLGAPATFAGVVAQGGGNPAINCANPPDQLTKNICCATVIPAPAYCGGCPGGAPLNCVGSTVYPQGMCCPLGSTGQQGYPTGNCNPAAGPVCQELDLTPPQNQPEPQAGMIPEVLLFVQIGLCGRRNPPALLACQEMAPTACAALYPPNTAGYKKCVETFLFGCFWCPL